ncbi:type VI secretion system ATPase TssH, partial [Leptospira borgpetersenii serovar Ballum]|uniref:hypothetical protein n=1 Tax=Leptospira borgpetersenii TaxID=174 RepID=UPI001A061FAC
INTQHKRVAKRLYENHKETLEYSDEVINYIIDQCHVSDTGARVLIRYIEQNILPQIGGILMNNAQNAKLSGVTISKRTECVLLARYC